MGKRKGKWEGKWRRGKGSGGDAVEEWRRGKVVCGKTEMEEWEERIRKGEVVKWL